MTNTRLLLAAAALAVALTASCAAGHQVSRRAVAAGAVTFDDYMTYDEVAAYLRALQQANPKLVTLASAGKTVEGREMWYVRVSSGGAANNVMVVDALLHAREWIVVPAALYFLQQIVQTPSLVRGLDVYVVPIVNPDGYEYSRTKDRLWRKNRAATSKKNCVGVDLNRNFDAFWDEFKKNGGASSDPCDLVYAGPKAASEPETRNVQNLILKLNANKRVKMYVDLHNPERSIYLPWGYSNTTAKVPDYSKLETIAKEANAALVKAGAKSYFVETMAADYPATGTATDWARQVGKIAQSFCMELPAGGSSKYQGFDIPKTDIKPIATQVFEALKVFVKYAQKPLSQ